MDRYLASYNLILVTSVGCFMAICTAGVEAQDGFRIETDIFLEGKAEPLSQTLTLFQNGIAYDIPRGRARPDDGGS